MKKYLLIGAGGFIGAICRFAVKNIHFDNNGGKLPVNTLLVNITGSFVLALLLGAVFELLHTDESLKLGISTGFFGAFTTFSTFCKEVDSLIMQSLYWDASFYIVLSIGLGILAVYSGFNSSKAIAERINKKYGIDLDDESVVNAEGEVE